MSHQRVVSVLWFPTRDGVSVSSAGSGAQAELPQGQMDSLLSIISSQRERFRSRNQELEVVSHPPPPRCHGDWNPN